MSVLCGTDLCGTDAPLPLPLAVPLSAPTALASQHRQNAPVAAALPVVADDVQLRIAGQFQSATRPRPGLQKTQVAAPTAPP